MYIISAEQHRRRPSIFQQDIIEPWEWQPLGVATPGSCELEWLPLGVATPNRLFKRNM